MADFNAGKNIFISGPYGQLAVNRNLFEESRKLHLLDGKSLPIRCPVRIIHATGDPYTPYQVSIDLIGKLESGNVQVCLVKSDDHRMSSDRDMQIMQNQLDLLLKDIA